MLYLSALISRFEFYSACHLNLPLWRVEVSKVCGDQSSERSARCLASLIFSFFPLDCIVLVRGLRIVG